MKMKFLALLFTALLLAGGCAERPELASSAADVSSAQTSADVSSAQTSADASSAADPSSEAASSAESADPASGASSQEGEPSSAAQTSTAPSQTGGALAESPRAEDSYFDDAVFIGDSVSLKLNLYVTNCRQSSNPTLLGKAQFLTAGSMGSGNALQPVSDDSIHPLYNGEKLSLADSVAASGAKKVYVMLGMNDLAVYGVDGAAANMETLLKGILEKTPDAQIFVQTATPLVKAKNIETNKLNNANMRLYNEKLAEVCENNGWYLVDVSSAVQDSEGNLNASYCSDPDDMGIHFTDEGCNVWIDYLYTHVPQ